MPTEFIESQTAPATESQIGIAPAGTELNVSQMSKVDGQQTQSAPAKKGSAKESIFADLRKRFQPQQAEVANAEQAPQESEEAESQEPEAQAKTEQPKAADKQPEKKKTSPWKLVEEYKSKTKELETRLADMEKKGVPPEKLKQYEDEIKRRDTRLEELEKEIRFVNYQKSEEFQQKYQKPYEEKWKQAMTDMSEVTVLGDDGAERAVEAKDILELVNLPLKEAKSLAEQKFGDFASDALQHRKDIRNLLDQQQKAIEAAKKEGVEFEKKQTETQSAAFKETSEVIRKTWAEANDQAVADPKYGAYFKPVEGDEQGNQRLSKGFELADRAFSENPLAPNWSPEERKAIVQRHAAVRNRCAAFGRLVYQNQQKEARIAELEKQLGKYNSAEPARGGSAPAKAGASSRSSAKQSIFDELRKRAK
jgi:hypothetical protein